MAHIQMSMPTTRSIDVTVNIHEHFVSQNKFNDCSALINCVQQRAKLTKNNNHKCQFFNVITQTTRFIYTLIQGNEMFCNITL
jgi:hypothetical protein